jgi:mono/diheme cytochrome c family protein
MHLRSLAIGALSMPLLIIALGYLAAVSGWLPVNADSKPSSFEHWLATTSLIASVKRSEPHGKNPVTATNANLMAGRNLYHDDCMPCHGDAQGARATIGQGFYQRAPRFGQPGVLDGIPYGYLFSVVKHGIRFTAMPSFGSRLSDRQISEVVLHLQQMGRPPDVVPLTPIPKLDIRRFSLSKSHGFAQSSIARF